MKKFALILSIFFTLFLVGCASETILSFDNKWSDGSIGYVETLTYDVTYEEDFVFSDYNFSKTNKAEKVTLDINGTYTVNNAIINANNDNLPKEVKNNPLLLDLSQIIVTVTNLSTESKYTIDGETKTYNDTLNTVGYYCSTDASLAPIYSVITYDYTIVKLSDSVNIEQVKGEDSIYYSNDVYKVTQKNLDPSNDEVLYEGTTEHEYTAKSLIDNTSFFMALRNKTFKKDAANYIPVVHSSYGEAQNLQATYFDDCEVEGLNVYNNGELKENVSVPTSVIKYHINKTNQSGVTQLAFIQNGDASGIQNKSLLVKYVAPISDYVSYLKLGATVYTLSSVSYNK